MNEDYDDIHEQAQRLYYQFKDTVDNTATPEMRELQEQIIQVREDIEANKKPRSIEDRIKRVQDLLHDIRENGAALMDPGDAEELYEAYKDLREQVRELPNY